MIDQYAWQLVDPHHARRDHRVVRNINKRYDKVCIIGMFPIPAAVCLETNVTIVDDSYILDYYSRQLNRLYGFNVVNKSPLFDDIQEEIDNSDLIIYHDSEYLVPLELFNHRHKNKDVLIMNTYQPNYKHCINYAYSKEDLTNIYPMRELFSSGSVPFVNYQDTNWIYGRLDD